MKVLMMGYYPDKSGAVFGGVQAAASVLSKELVKQPGIELEVLTCKAGLEQEETVSPNGFPVHYLPLKGERGALLTQYWLDRVRLHAKIAEVRPDIIHVQGTGFYALAALASGIPSVVTVHGVFFQNSKFYFGRGPLAVLKRAAYNNMNARSLRRAQHLICISQYTSTVLGHLSGAARYFISNPVDPTYLGCKRCPQGERLLFVGTIFPLKGVDYLLEAFERLHRVHPNLSLNLVGGVGDQAYYRSLLRRIEAQGLADRVIFSGQQDIAAIAEEYASCTMLVLPSLDENAPIVVSEAMIVGCPVVATRVGAIPEMIEDSVSGLIVEPRDPKGLASAISRLLKDRTLRETISARAREAALGRYAPEVVAEKTVEVYQRILQACP